MDATLLVLVCVGLIALAVALQARHEARAARRMLAELASRLDLLEQRILRNQLERRLGTTDVAPASPLATVEPAQVSAAALGSETLGVLAQSPYLPTVSAAPVTGERKTAMPEPNRAPTVQSPSPAPLGPKVREPRRFDWESLISVRVFAWLGGGALFLGATLFLQYSIQHGLIAPSVRVVIGLLVGVAALLGGDWMRKKAQWAGQATSGAGAAILYASLFAAHERYHLLSTPLTFIGMALVTTSAGIMAVRRNAFLLALLGLLGGFLTPYLLSTPEDHPIALFGYVLLLNLGVLAMGRRRGWIGMQLLALIASAILYAAWAAKFLDQAKLPWAMLAAAALAGLFMFVKPEDEFEDEFDGWRKEVARDIPLLAALAPLLLALGISSMMTLVVAPTFLVGYLLLLAAGAVLVSQRADFAPLTVVSAIISVITLTVRVRPDLFPSRRTETLLLFAVLPAAYLFLWLSRRGRAEASAFRVAAAISLCGALPIVVAVLMIENRSEPALPLWLFVAAHAAGLLLVGAVLKSGGWIASSQGLLYFGLLCLASRFEKPRLPEFLPFLVLPTLLFWILPFLARRCRSDHASWWSAAAAPVLHYPVLYVLAKPTWGKAPLGATALFCAVGAFLTLKLAVRVSDDPEDRRFATALFGVVTLLFATASIPIFLDKEWITIAWALEAAALAWLATRIDADGLLKAAAVLAAAAFVRLVLNPEVLHYHPRTGMPILNWYLYTFGVPAAAFLWTARWASRNAWARSARFPDALRAASGILIFALLNLEIADYYSTGVSLTFRLSGGGLQEDMTYSLAWGVFAIAVLFIGLARRSKQTRAAALIVLVLTIGKVSLHDLWDLGALYRVGSIVGLAIALLAVSFLTQRFVFSKERS